MTLLDRQTLGGEGEAGLPTKRHQERDRGRSGMSREEDVVRHYAVGDLMDRIVAALRQAGVDPERPTAADLAPVDEFHIGGAAATEAFAARLPFRAGDRLLDVGSGLGGPARFLARRFDAHVTGIDLTAEYVEVARRLSALTGQADRTAFDVGSALAMPYGDRSFDGAVTIHVAMNIHDRERFYAEIGRVLRPGAGFGLYDVMRRHSAAPLDYPVPWAMTSETSRVTTPGETQALLAAAGFDILAFEDRTAHARDFFERVVAATRQSGGPPPIGLHLLTGATHGQKFANMLSALADGRLAPGMIVARKR
jgi:SAM-dependent methyltransferase